jgi:hypothetical protein
MTNYTHDVDPQRDMAREHALSRLTSDERRALDRSYHIPARKPTSIVDVVLVVGGAIPLFWLVWVVLAS